MIACDGGEAAVRSRAEFVGALGTEERPLCSELLSSSPFPCRCLFKCTVSAYSLSSKRSKCHLQSCSCIALLGWFVAALASGTVMVSYMHMYIEGSYDF